MINKIKDFLKNKLRKKTSQDLYGQEEILDHFKDEDKTNPGFQLEVKRSQLDATGEIYILTEDLASSSKAPFSGKPTLKDKINNSFSFFIEKIKGRKGILFQNLISKSNGSPLLSPSLSRSIEKFLSRSSREPIHQAALVVLVCAITYTLGKTTAIVLKGSPHLDSSKDYTVSIPIDDSFNPATLNQVKSINVFRTNTGLIPKKGLADKKCEEAQQSSNLPIKLVNTIVLQDSIK